MNIKEYRKAIERTMNKELSEREKVSMLSMGALGELGEVVDSLKKVYYHGHELDREELIKELGDFSWYFFHLLNLFDIDEEEVFDKNDQKLKKRYKDGFSEKASIERVDTKEEEAL